MATAFYLTGLSGIIQQTINWDTDTIKLALCTSAYTPNYTTHDFLNDITNELTGYTRPTLTTSFSVDTGNDRIELVANDVTISSVTTGQTIGTVVVFKDTGTSSTSALIGATTGLSQATNDGDITIDFSAEGFLAINRTV